MSVVKALTTAMKMPTAMTPLETSLVSAVLATLEMGSIIVQVYYDCGQIVQGIEF